MGQMDGPNLPVLAAPAGNNLPRLGFPRPGDDQSIASNADLAELSPPCERAEPEIRRRIALSKDWMGITEAKDRSNVNMYRKRMMLINSLIKTRGMMMVRFAPGKT